MTYAGNFETEPLNIEECIPQAKKTLIIGNFDRWYSEGRITTDLSDYKFAEFKTLSDQSLRNSSPDIILSPLFGDDFDALDIAKMLGRLGFRGRYRVVSAPLPNAKLIREEIEDLAPGVDFDLLTLPC